MVLHAFVADVHVTNPVRFGGPTAFSMNQRCGMILRTLSNAYKLARSKGASSFSVLGDLFDHPNPNPRMVAAVQEIFHMEDDIERRVITGNHDPNSSAPGDHALAPLWDHVRVIDQPEALDYKAHRSDRASFIYVPHTSEDFPEYLDAVLTKHRHPDTQRCVLCFHAGIKDKNTAPWLQSASDAISITQLRDLVKKHRITRAFCGHWHNYRSWSDHQIVQLGALCPTGWNNPGLEGYGGVTFYDEDKEHVWREEIPGPRFVQVHVEDTGDGDWKQMLAPTAEAKERGNTLFLQMVVPQERVKEFTAIKDEHQGRYHVVDIVMDKSEAEVAARNAAQAAKSVDSLAEATVAWVTEMFLEEGIPRNSVLRQVRRYLNV